MERRRLVSQTVERVLDLRLERRERCDGPTLGLGRIVGNDVELRAVAGREAHGLAELERHGMRVVAVERNALPELDRCVMVRGSDENEMHQLKCTAGSARRTT